MTETKFTSVESYLKKESITKRELLNKAKSGEIELLLYLRRVESTLNQKAQFREKTKRTNLIEVSGLCGLLPQHFENGLENEQYINKSGTISLRFPLELIEGEYKKPIDEISNNQHIVGWDFNDFSGGRVTYKNF